MSPGILAFIIGVYIVPVALLAWGHKIRRLGPRSRRAFWGAIIGHCIAGTAAITWGMIPPESWTAADTARGFFGLWAMLLLPIAGGIGGALTATDSR
jgi:hypothetical protein